MSNEVNNNKKKSRLGMKLQIHHWKMIAVCLLIYDVIAVNFSYFFGLWIRFDFSFSKIPWDYMTAYIKFAPWYTGIVAVFFWFMHMYRSVWRFVGVNELLRYMIATITSSVIHCVGITVLYRRMPFSYYIVGSVIQAILVIGIRFSYRFYLTVLRNRRNLMESVSADTSENRSVKNVMIIGGGAAGRNVIRELLQTEKLKGVPRCVIDDNSNKWGRFIEGVPVVGGRDVILDVVEKYQIHQIFFSIPTATAKQKKEILDICSETGCEMKILPGVYQLVNGEVLLSKMKPVAVEDLLGREPIKVNMDEIFHFIKGKVVLVTGGGGSIGSELCRRIAEHHPKQLIIFDVYENNAYDIQQELKKKYPELDLPVIIGSVRDSRKIFQVFETYKPNLVYHAAAHKHVPLMEDSPCEAIKNNAIGTYKTAFAAMANGTDRFVLISTDKAVNPTNIMGASKRLCEMIIQAFDHKVKEGKAAEVPQLFTHWMSEVVAGKEVKERLENARTEFVAVRFGNVLGSNGSVIPLFKKQIAAGGPVTVTHPEIIRYFMTIPEAVNLVLQAGTYARGGEIFVLDMGSPVKIDTLARNLIKLSGYKPDVDIKVIYTGLRSGEKLFEEMLMSEEGLKKTSNELIYIGCPIPFDVEVLLAQLEELMRAAYANSDDIRERVAEIVNTYHPCDVVKGEGKESDYKNLMKEVAVTAERVEAVEG